jgi:hypothetical protein
MPILDIAFSSGYDLSFDTLGMLTATGNFLCLLGIPPLVLVLYQIRLEESTGYKLMLQSLLINDLALLLTMGTLDMINLSSKSFSIGLAGCLVTHVLIYTTCFI